MRFPTHTGLLDQALTQARARLVVIHPVVAFLDDGILGGSDEGVGGARLPLARLAENHQCAALLVRQLNKIGGRRALYRGGGAISFICTCRADWLIAPDPHDPGGSVLA